MTPVKKIYWCFLSKKNWIWNMQEITDRFKREKEIQYLFKCESYGMFIA